MLGLGLELGSFRYGKPPLNHILLDRPAEPRNHRTHEILTQNPKPHNPCQGLGLSFGDSGSFSTHQSNGVPAARTCSCPRKHPRGRTGCAGSKASCWKGLPIGPIVVPFWGLPYRILVSEPQKGTTMGPLGRACAGCRVKDTRFNL